VEALRTSVRRASARLRDRVGGWSPDRWAAPLSDGRSKADLVYAVVQQIADLAAEAEGQPRRVVPRLTNDVALPDQLTVVVNDLLGVTADRAALEPVRNAIEIANRAL
jgi:hypothetical protein